MRLRLWCLLTLLGWLLSTSAWCVEAPLLPLQIKVVCTQQDAKGKTQDERTFTLLPAKAASQTFRLQRDVLVRFESQPLEHGRVQLQYYVVAEGNGTYGPNESILSIDADPVTATFYLGTTTWQVELTPIDPRPKMMDCPTCGGTGKCQDCAGTGHVACKTCKGTGACQVCAGSGVCPYCGGAGCALCNQTGNCSVCSGTGKCINCFGKGRRPPLCETCNGTGECQTCGGTGRVPVPKDEKKP